MSNVLKMNYPEAEKMVEVLKAACDQLQDTISEMENVASALEGGVLLGDAGEAFAGGIRKQLLGALNKLVEGLEDGARYVNVEIQDMKMAESKSASQFK